MKLRGEEREKENNEFLGNLSNTKQVAKQPAQPYPKKEQVIFPPS